MSEAITLDGVSRRYGSLTIFEELNLSIEEGGSAALLGPSGSGKSSLLHIAGLLEKPSAGEVTISGSTTAKLSDRQRTAIRRETVGFVYQFHHLLPEFNARMNVMIPMLIKGLGEGAAKKRAGDLLDRLGLAERLSHQPAQLSGGEKQRVAIARALANEPRLILADEPTGNLDQETSAKVFDLLVETQRESGMAMIVATHDEALAARLPRILRIKGQHLVG
ncbi:MAG: ABC transporter ATP-binding protein [Pseudomonadota bacterium]